MVVADRHFVHRTLIALRFRIVVAARRVGILRAHLERAALYPHQVRDQVPYHGFLLLANVHRVVPMNEDPVDIVHRGEIVVFIDVIALYKDWILAAGDKDSGNGHKNNNQYNISQVHNTQHNS